ncbi:methylated-DNA--[protein]-cysteine S-methyltransferase [Crocinitomix sp.]|nr:methylated-DNA--[protein]-cysteine S-methyltransferase [Crocinitomix sp.]
MSENSVYKIFNSPIGQLVGIGDKDGIELLEFLSDNKSPLDSKEYESVIEGRNAILDQLELELAHYFNGTLQNFTIPTTPKGTTFQKSVWKALLDVQYGITKTYKEQTDVLGDPKAIRAVANANGKNRIAIVIPCHRIIGSNGNLTGYAGGIERKRFLLDLERKLAGPKDLFNL